MAMSPSGWMVGTRLLVTDPEWVLRVQVGNPMIFDVDLRNAVIGGWQQKAIIKTDFARTGFQESIPIRSGRAPEPEVPFADNRSVITRRLE